MDAREAFGLPLARCRLLLQLISALIWIVGPSPYSKHWRIEDGLRFPLTRNLVPETTSIRTFCIVLD